MKEETLNYIEHFLILASTVAGSISISTFTSFIGIPNNFSIRLKICAIASEIRKYTSIIKKRKRNMTNQYCQKSKLKSMGVLISKVLINSVISKVEFISINNLQKEYDKMKEETKKDLNSSSKVLVYVIILLEVQKKCRK